MGEREMVSADEARAMGPQHAAAEAVRLRDTVIALHAIVEGRTVAPTNAELAAHDATGATWMIAHRDGQIVVTAMSWLSKRDWHVGKGATRWWPLTSDGRPCAWPIVAEVSRG